MSRAGLGSFSSEVVLRAALGLFCDCLWVNPVVASRAFAELSSGLRLQLAPFAEDISLHLLQLLESAKCDQSNKLGQMLSEDKALAERTYASIARFALCIPSRERKDAYLHMVVSGLLSQLTQVAEKMSLSSQGGTVQLWTGWNGTVSSLLAAMRGLMFGLRNDETVVPAIPFIQSCLAELASTLHCLATKACHSPRVEDEALALLDQTLLVLATVSESPLAEESFGKVTGRMITSLLPPFAVPGFPTLMATLVLWGADRASLIPPIAILVAACLEKASGILMSREGSSGYESSSLPDYLCICFRVVRQMCKSAPAMLLTVVPVRTTATSSPSCLSPATHALMVESALDLTALVLRSEDFLVNQKLFRAAAFALLELGKADVVQSRWPAISDALITRFAALVGPVLWGLLFGSLERTVTISASLLEGVFRIVCRSTPDENAKETLVLSLLEPVCVQMEQALLVTGCNDRVAANVITVTDKRGDFALSVTDVLEVVALSLARCSAYRRGGPSLKLCLSACVRLARSRSVSSKEFQGRGTLAVLRWPARFAWSPP